MKIFSAYDQHTNKQRDLIAWENICGLPEIKILTTKIDKAFLGGTVGHYHPYSEMYVLAHGECTWYIWNKDKGQEQHFLMAPKIFMIEPYEEHAVIAGNDMVLIGLLSQKYESNSHVDAENLVIPELK